MTEAHPKTRDRATVAGMRLWAVLLLVAGFLLRRYLLLYQPFISTDSLMYQDIAHNWLRAGIYGQTMDGIARPTLIRLPGYPAVLALCSWIFDHGGHAIPGSLPSFFPVLYLQILADLGTCVLCARIVHKLFGTRAARATLAVACLCPFTANYAAVPLTEAFTLFSLTLACFALQRWLAARRTADLVLLAFAIAWSCLLRPDQGLLAIALLPALFLAPGKDKSIWKRLQPVVLCVALISIPFVAWTARNLHTFGLFQPLAPKQAIDPGEVAPLGFQRWFRTWATDFNASQDAYWKYPEEAILMSDLPPRAFDSPAQRDRTAALLHQAAVAGTFDPQVEQGLNAIGLERIHANPLRYYVWLPAARLTDMLVHPRIEMLPVAEHWWEFRAHRGQTVFAFCYGALNLACFAAALFGFPRALRANRILISSMAAYVVLRCLLLMTIDNVEQRYTLEFFPMIFLCIGALFPRKAARKPA